MARKTQTQTQTPKVTSKAKAPLSFGQPEASASPDDGAAVVAVEAKDAGDGELPVGGDDPDEVLGLMTDSDEAANVLVIKAENAPGAEEQDAIVIEEEDMPAPGIGTGAEALLLQMSQQMADFQKQMMATQKQLAASNARSLAMEAEVRSLRGIAPSGGNGVDGGRIPEAAEAVQYLMSYRQVLESEGEELYARMVPFNQAKRRMAMNRTFHRIRVMRQGRSTAVALRGGTGLPGDEPKWAHVNKEAALMLLKEKQHPSRTWHHTTQCVEVATVKGMTIIDACENAARSARAGIDHIYVRDVAAIQHLEGFDDLPPDVPFSEGMTPMAGVGGGNGGDMSVRDLTREGRTDSGGARAKITEVPRAHREAAAKVLADLPAGSTDLEGGAGVMRGGGSREGIGTRAGSL